jgi:phage gpG-like protein
MEKQRFGFDVVLQNFKKNELKLARKIGIAHKNYFLKSFDKQAWGLKLWKEVKRRIKGTPEYKYPKRKGLSRRKRKILIGSGALRRAVNNSMESITPKMIRYKVKRPYAEIHNEGGRTWNGGKIPKRQYIGWNKETNKIAKDILNQHVLDNFK